jgi:hypothetical protein
MIIRAARLTDLPRLIELFQIEIAYQKEFAPVHDLPPNFDVARFAKLKLNNPHERVLVAEMDGAIAGYIDVRVLRPPQYVFLKILFG